MALEPSPDFSIAIVGAGWVRPLECMRRSVRVCLDSQVWGARCRNRPEDEMEVE